MRFIYRILLIKLTNEIKNKELYNKLKRLLIAQKESIRINEEIRAPKVRVIDVDGTQLGVFLL